MAKSVLERCDLIVGEKEGADYFAAIGSRKVGEETHYAFGAYLHVPAKFKTGDADVDKACLLWCKRMASADNAGLPAKIKAGDMTAQEAADIVLSYDGEAFLERLNETKVRAEGTAKVDSDESLAIRFLMKVLRKAQEGGTLASAKVPVPGADSPPKTEKGAINYNAWAKAVKAAEHPWYAVAYKKVTASDKGFD
jgi:hypothetical protein